MDNFGLPSIGGAPVLGTTATGFQVVTPNATRVAEEIKPEPKKAVDVKQYFTEPVKTQNKPAKDLAKSVFESVLKQGDDTPAAKKPIAKKATAKKTTAKKAAVKKAAKKVAAKVKAATKPAKAKKK